MGYAIDPPCTCGHTKEEHDSDRGPSSCTECPCIAYEPDPTFMECTGGGYGFRGLELTQTYYTEFAPIERQWWYKDWSKPMTGNVEARLKAYEAIESERSYQEMRKKRDSGAETNSVEEYLLYMEDYLDEARTVATRTWGPEADNKALEVLRKVVTLGVACMETHGAPIREGHEAACRTFWTAVKIEKPINAKFIDAAAKLYNECVMIRFAPGCCGVDSAMKEFKAADDILHGRAHLHFNPIPENNYWKKRFINACGSDSQTLDPVKAMREKLTQELSEIKTADLVLRHLWLKNGFGAEARAFGRVMTRLADEAALIKKQLTELEEKNKAEAMPK